MIDRRNNLKAEEEERLRNPNAERKKIIAYLEKVSDDIKRNKPATEQNYIEMNKALCAEAHEYRLPRGFEGPLAVHVKRSMNEDLLTAIM